MNKSFAIQENFSDRGVVSIIVNYKYRILKNIEGLKEDEIPYGSVEWIEKILNKNITPNYFPNFLHKFIHRKWRVSNDWPYGEKCFIKPNYRHKAWQGFVYNGEEDIKPKQGPYLIQEVVRFRNEYRYYVVNGKVLSGWWYWGDSLNDKQIHEGENIPDAPKLPKIDWPKSFCGAVDFGELYDTNKLVLIESNFPYSCGWYGEHSNHKDFAEFLEKGWLYVKNDLYL